MTAPQKPRIRILRTEPHRTIIGKTDTIWRYEFGDPSNHRAVEAWGRMHPSIGPSPKDTRAAPGPASGS